MSVKLSVSVSRKTSTANYGSHGGTCGLEVELASALLADPAKLAATIRGHFALCETAVDEELARLGPVATNGTAPGHAAPAKTQSAAVTTRTPRTNGQAPPRTAARPAAEDPGSHDHDHELDDQDADDLDEENPPINGSQLLGWARKQPHDAKGFLIGAGKKHGFPPRILDWSQDQVTTVYRSCRRAALNGR